MLLKCLKNWRFFWCGFYLLWSMTLEIKTKNLISIKVTVIYYMWTCFMKRKSQFFKTKICSESMALFYIYIFKVWLNRGQPDSPICLSVKAIAVLFWLESMKKIWPQTDMELEEERLLNSLFRCPLVYLLLILFQN